MIKAYAAKSAQSPLEKFEYSPGALGSEHVEIKVEYCGLCHSDYSMLHNEWGMTKYPFVPGHEVVGTVAVVGSAVNPKTLKVGDRVGLGWFAESCMHCHQCMSGNHNLCGTAEQTIVGRHGGFADRVRAHESWAVKLPTGMDPAKAGPLFCGGITVFNPIIECGVKPTHKVGVIGIGGLGHLALQFLNKWGCEVTAFSSNPAKAKEIKVMGAHKIASSTDAKALEAMAGMLDFILVTAPVPLAWPAIVNCLSPKGKLHFVGAVPEPISVAAFALIGGQKSISGSPLGSPDTTATMLDFCVRHGIEPVTELFPMSRANEAMAHLESGKARYRVVLKSDF
jgi:alcohol/geraniol dehydrogenase (NADP+)